MVKTSRVLEWKGSRERQCTLELPSTRKQQHFPPHRGTTKVLAVEALAPSARSCEGTPLTSVIGFHPIPLGDSLLKHHRFIDGDHCSYGT